MKRTPLRRKTPLRAYTPLRRTTPLAKQSKKAKQEAVVWGQAKKLREVLLREKYGYLPCEWCGTAILGGQDDGHHNDRNRRNNTTGNARLLHRFCHTFVTDKNIEDVPSLL